MSQELRAQSLKTTLPLTLQPAASPGHRCLLISNKFEGPMTSPHIRYIA